MSKKKKGATFVVEIKNTQAQSWQGNVTWVESREKCPFRSAFELLTLIDSAVEDKMSDNPLS